MGLCWTIEFEEHPAIKRFCLHKSHGSQISFGFNLVRASQSGILNTMAVVYIGLDRVLHVCKSLPVVTGRTSGRTSGYYAIYMIQIIADRSYFILTNGIGLIWVLYKCFDWIYECKNMLPASSSVAVGAGWLSGCVRCLR